MEEKSESDDGVIERYSLQKQKRKQKSKNKKTVDLSWRASPGFLCNNVARVECRLEIVDRRLGCWSEVTGASTGAGAGAGADTDGCASGSGGWF